MLKYEQEKNSIATPPTPTPIKKKATHLPSFLNYMAGLQEILRRHRDVIVLVRRVQMTLPAYVLLPATQQQQQEEEKLSPAA